MPAAATATPEHIKQVNCVYHDGAAASYDAKWGIDFGDVGRDQVRMKLTKALGTLPAHPFGDALEIGSGTGYFSLNMLRTGLVERVTATDISPGMLEVLANRAVELGLEVQTGCTDAESLPYDDESFDLVFGHAVLHHIPDLPRALSEFHRVLRPGGSIAFCGEPSRYGDTIAAAPKRAGTAASPLWCRLVGATPRGEGSPTPCGHEHESEVDVHAFRPRDLESMLDRAGFTGRRIKGEELLANLYGWTLRTLEGGADPETVPWGWRQFAFRSYVALQGIDTRILEPHLPPELFYNLVLSARRSGP